MKLKACVSVCMCVCSFIEEKNTWKDRYHSVCSACIWGVMLAGRDSPHILQCGLNFVYSESELIYNE